MTKLQVYGMKIGEKGGGVVKAFACCRDDPLSYPESDNKREFVVCPRPSSGRFFLLWVIQTYTKRNMIDVF